jgi:lipopolysaccharide biosynthesis glycosyltransferase
MKNLIYKVKLGDSNPLYDWCIESSEKYCKKHSIDHIVQTEPILKINPDWKNTNRSKQSCSKFGCLPILEKHNALDFLSQYDQILILDADVYIKETASNIFLQPKEDAVFSGVLECEMPITPQYRKKILQYSKGQYASIAKSVPGWSSTPKDGYPFWNMGVMLLSNKFLDYMNGMKAKEFLLQKQFKPFVDGKGNWKWSTDQTLMNWWIRKTGMKTENLEWKWNALYKGIEDKRLPEAFFVHFFLQEHHVKNFNPKKLEKEIK